jgi:hypothetical protein
LLFIVQKKYLAHLPTKENISFIIVTLLGE